MIENWGWTSEIRFGDNGWNCWLRKFKSYQKFVLGLDIPHYSIIISLRKSLHAQDLKKGGGNFLAWRSTFRGGWPVPVNWLECGNLLAFGYRFWEAVLEKRAAEIRPAQGDASHTLLIVCEDSFVVLWLNFLNVAFNLKTPYSARNEYCKM